MSSAPRTLKIPRTLYDEILAHCRLEFPKEACGILAAAKIAGATPAEPDRRVIQRYPMRNAENSPLGYSMDPKEQLLVEKQMRRQHQRMLGVYHSHTATEAYPSSVDVSLALSPDLSYVLVSFQNRAKPVFRSYLINGTVIEEEHVEIEAGPVGAN
ncbi:MAG: M67 family metallopeptidase [Candidatus Omnitrophica bacterium]|nr:M67 family metallopeptidase [Candidatus Omnitrophota bacterium]